MLLLVLILVLIAFGLLVVALLTETALFAWVSVAVSVIAAVVLVIDWIRRRAAVRSTEPELASGPVPVPVPVPARSTVRRVPVLDDPVTEQLPAVPQDRVPVRPAPARADVADTVLLAPAGTPSGSTDQPPGAADAATRSGDDGSPAVTADPDRATSNGTTPPAHQPGDDPGPDDPGAQHDQRAEGAPEPESIEAAERPVEPGEAADQGEPAADAGTETAADAGTEQAEADAGTEPAAESGTEQAEAEPVDAEPADAEGAAQPDPNAPAAEPAGAAAVGPGPGAGSDSGQVLFDTADDRTMVLPAVKNAEPPEEPRDPSNAALVAGLPDEVAVIDERPRYHLTVCRFLPGKTLIRLPVREAVELGFTPCGWCNPDGTLSGRHRATSSR